MIVSTCPATFADGSYTFVPSSLTIDRWIARTDAGWPGVCSTSAMQLVIAPKSISAASPQMRSPTASGAGPCTF